MPSELRCTQCGRQLQAGDASPGTRILCPGCGAFSTVPGSPPGPAIEFRCSGCGKLLRTPADAAGKPAKCPDCGAVSTVPAATAAEPPPPPPPSSPGDIASPFAAAPRPAAPADAANPYMAPTQYGPPPPQPLAGTEQMAAARVAGPAIALIVIAAIGLPLQIIGVIFNLFGAALNLGQGQGQNALPVMLSGGFGVVVGLISVVGGVLIILGGLKMKKLESYSLAMAASILVMIPYLSPCCCLIGLPFGIWSLVVLSDPGVKAAFRS